VPGGGFEPPKAMPADLQALGQMASDQPFCFSSWSFGRVFGADGYVTMPVTSCRAPLASMSSPPKRGDLAPGVQAVGRELRDATRYSSVTGTVTVGSRTAMKDQGWYL
jgi:hypothetical protein